MYFSFVEEKQQPFFNIYINCTLVRNNVSIFIIVFTARLSSRFYASSNVHNFEVGERKERAHAGLKELFSISCYTGFR